MASAFALALHAYQPGAWCAYHVGSGHPSTVHDVIATAETVAGRPVPPVPPRHAVAAHEPARLWADSTPHPLRTGLAIPKVNPPEIISDAWTALNSD